MLLGALATLVVTLGATIRMFIMGIETAVPGTMTKFVTVGGALSAGFFVLFLLLLSLTVLNMHQLKRATEVSHV